MKRDYWVAESGICTENELAAAAAKVPDCRYCMALYPDRFVCRKWSAGSALEDCSSLLELRIFGDNRELWIHRSALGTAFSWRIADDCFLNEAVKEESPAFLQNPELYRMETKQLLDIDKTVAIDSPPLYGGRPLRTTVGGDYELPIEDEDAVILVSYLEFGDDGMANVSDFRLKGFGHMKVGGTNE